MAPAALSAPQRDRVTRMVLFLDTSADGVLSASEVKVLFSKLLDIPEVPNPNPRVTSACVTGHTNIVQDQIPDDHEMVVAYDGLSTEKMVEKLCEDIGPDELDQYFLALFPDEAST
jgi:hypothetical protein